MRSLCKLNVSYQRHLAFFLLICESALPTDLNFRVSDTWPRVGVAQKKVQFWNWNLFDFIGIPEKGPSSRHLLPVVAVPWPPVPPWIESSGPLHLCFPFAQRRSLCQSVSLHKDRPTYSATSTRTYKLEEQQRSKFPLAHTLSDFPQNMDIFAPVFATKLTSHFWGFSV